LAPFDNAPQSETDRRSDAIGNAILDTLAIGETQLYDLLIFASVPAKYIDLLKAALRYRNFPNSVEVHGKYILASPR
jgi:hypothetical protein